MSKIEAVLFDLDGTLLDSFPDFLASLENININSSSKKIDESIVRANVSDGSSKLLKLVFDIDADDEGFDEHKRNFLNEYEKNKKSSLLRQSKVVICCDDGFKSKPNPEGINHACNILGVSNSKCIYVGDHENDLNASLAAGTISGVCTFGYGFKKGLIIDGAENFESPLQILDFIKRNV